MAAGVIGSSSSAVMVDVARGRVCRGDLSRHWIGPVVVFGDIVRVIAYVRRR